jgi:hypothetical protein
MVLFQQKTYPSFSRQAGSAQRVSVAWPKHDLRDGRRKPFALLTGNGTKCLGYHIESRILDAFVIYI